MRQMVTAQFSNLANRGTDWGRAVQISNGWYNMLAICSNGGKHWQMVVVTVVHIGKWWYTLANGAYMIHHQVLVHVVS